ncbi:MAG: GNAT family N-acetyltransferase [Eubacteriales bacterium]|nr:GNAT family N-acetyltransferase [Eubacteriales bacterium]
MNTNLSIRMAVEEDAEEILSIYSPYVINTAITFEYEAPSAAEFSKRIKNILKKYPYIVALEEKCIVGFAYASVFRERPAYNRAAETSIYLRQDCRGRGLGKKMYLALGDILKCQNVINLNAGIAYTTVEDVHLDNTSMVFHEHLGYSKVAHFTKCGYKFGKWYDVIWMEKMLGEHSETPAQFIPISEIQS